MSWYSKVTWSEGLFLRPHHLQQADRYLENLLERRVRLLTPYPWGFDSLEIDRDLAQRAKFGLRKASGVMSDGTPFDMPAGSPLPTPCDITEGAAGQYVWLTLPVASVNTREIDPAAESASRYEVGTELVIDSTSNLRSDEEIDVAHPRLALEIRPRPKPGYLALAIARVIEVRDQTVVFDEAFAPPVLSCMAHPVVEGWIDRVVGWIETKCATLARYAADPGAGGGLQGKDYLVLQLLNRHMPVLKHLRQSRYTHPERLYEELLRVGGELATFSTLQRRARDYPAYVHDDLQKTFEPLLRDIQEFLSTGLDTRAIRLDIVDRGPNIFVSTIRDRSLFRNAQFVLEVSARRPLTEIQQQFPNLFKIGPNTKMNEIVHAHLPGVALIHLPTPPPQLHVIVNHVYFAFDNTSPLWPEFSTATAIGMHFSGNWPELELELWAIPEGKG